LCELSPTFSVGQGSNPQNVDIMNTPTRIAISLLIAVALLTGCDSSENENPEFNTPPKGFDLGKVSGFDPEKCNCCHGFITTIKNKTYRFTDDDVDGDNMLSSTGMKYPVYVYLKWSKKSDCDAGINVQELQLATTK
jgi:hypothetical protein